MSLSLEKKIQTLSLEKKAPKLVPLAKKARLSLEKRNLAAHTAQVALVMDVSRSMTRLFNDGTVQDIIERAMAVGINFDDNGAIDLFTFGVRGHNLGELKPESFSGAASQILKTTGYENGTRYAKAIEEVLSHYGFITQEKTTSFFGLFSSVKNHWNPPSKAEFPIFVLFITDGENSDRAATTSLIVEAAKYPVFFQFIGIGGASFYYLQELDDISGRYVDNADFFEVKDPKAMGHETLFDKMMTEYPNWVKTVTEKGRI